MTRMHWFKVFWSNARVKDHGSFEFRTEKPQMAVEMTKRALVEDKNYNQVDIKIVNCYQIPR